MSNLLVAMESLVKNPQLKLTRFYSGSNRANNMGDALEAYIKDLFSASFEMDEGKAWDKHREVFSYLGNKNNPPDAILKGGDAIEVKKIESLKTGLALNSSYPKAKLYRDSPLLTDACKKVEDGNWSEKDIIYIIGIVGSDKDSKIKDVLKGIWFVYGDCYAASKDIYERIADKIVSGIQEIPTIELSATNELARVNKVDPLGITYLRVRGMWGIDNPIKVFDYLNLKTSDEFFAHAIMRKTKFEEFPSVDQDSIFQLGNKMKKSQENGSFIIEYKKLKNPDNPADMIDTVILSYTK